MRSRHIIADLQIQARPFRFRKTSAMGSFKKYVRRAGEGVFKQTEGGG